MVEIKNTGITGVCIDIMTSSYPMVKKQLNMGKYKRKKCDELHGSPESSISVCNPPLPLVAKSKALTPTKKKPFSIDYMINSAAVFISKTHVFKYAMLRNSLLNSIMHKMVHPKISFTLYLKPHFFILQNKKGNFR